MILLTGATGVTGSEIAKRLTAQGALARDVAKAKALLRAEIAIVQGDLGQPTTLESALDGVETVFLLPPDMDWLFYTSGHGRRRSRHEQ